MEFPSITDLHKCFVCNNTYIYRYNNYSYFNFLTNPGNVNEYFCKNCKFSYIISYHLFVVFINNKAAYFINNSGYVYNVFNCTKILFTIDDAKNWEDLINKIHKLEIFK